MVLWGTNYSFLNVFYAVQHDLIYRTSIPHRSSTFGLTGALGSMPVCGYGFEFKIECSSARNIGMRWGNCNNEVVLNMH